MGSLNLPVRDQTCLRSLLWFALQLMLLLRLRPMPRLMLDFCMEDMDMDLMDTQDLDIMAGDPLMLNPRLNQRLRLMLVLAMVDTDMVLDLMDTLDLDIMARDQLMLNQRLRLMLDFCMEDMDMVLVLAMLV